MTAAEPPSGAPEPLAKNPPPPLTGRAERPRPVRIRAGAVRALVGAGVLLVSGSLAWAFVVQPELREAARERRAEDRPPADGTVRPSEQITERPARYDRLEPDALPPPRIGGSDPEPPPEPSVAAAGPIAPASPSPRRQRAEARRQAAETARASGLFFPLAATASATDTPAPGPVRTAGDDDVYNPHALTAPRSPWEVKAGAVIPAALLTAVDTSRPGPVAAVVAETVFDTLTGRHVLIPQGARLIGRHDGDSAHGERRAFIVWERLILPNGKSLRLEGAPGVDAQGAVGVRGETDRRLLPLAGASLIAGVVTALGEFARGGARDDDRGSWLGTAGDAAAIQAAETGGRIVDRELGVRPVVRVRPGARVRVLVTRDLILEPYRP